MIYLHKFIPIIFSPLGVIIFFIFLNIIRPKKWLNLACFFLVIIGSLPWISNVIWQTLERTYPPIEISSLKTYDAAVVLSGEVSSKELNGQTIIDWKDADRFFAALDLLKTGKAKRLIFTQGQLPWSDSLPEGLLLKNKAMSLGVDEDKLLLTAVASNTYEEAIVSLDVIRKYGINNVLLITSSFHMPRAIAIFSKVGIVADAFPVDFKAQGKTNNWLEFIPNAGALNRTSNGLREFIGRLYYLVFLKF